MTGISQPPNHKAQVARARLAGVAVTLAVACGLVGVVAADRMRLAKADRQFWEVKGAPCPALTRQDFQAAWARRGNAEQAFDFAGAHFVRESGWSSCQGLQSAQGAQSQPVCQFNRPGLIAVRTASAQAYFNPDWRKGATISLVGGSPRCVENANLR